MSSYFDKSKLEKELAEHHVAASLKDATGSTNDDMKRFVGKSEILKPHLLAVRHQSAGRGTHGKSWQSVDLALLFSLAVPVSSPEGIFSLAAGMAVCDAARRHGIQMSLKWPNDLWLQGSKVGGILCESVRDAQGRRVLIAGVGCNLKNSNANLSTTTNGWRISDLAAGSDLDFSDAAVRTELLADIVREMLERWHALDGRSAEDISSLWPFYDAFIGRKITLVRKGTGERLTGTDAGIDAFGRLKLTLHAAGTEPETLCCTDGELSLSS